MKPTTSCRSFAWLLAAVFMGADTLLGSAAHAQPPTQDFDFDWVTIDSPRNPAYPGDPFGTLRGRGRVNYRYRMSRLEVTTGQWMEFINTFTVRGGPWEYFILPVFWGAEPDPNYPGPGLRYRLRDVPNAEMLPVSGVSWYDSARLCNWLHNGKSSDPASLEYGAYDASTWGIDPNGLQTDGSRLPGARFWIPDLDEWLKAAHFDPDRYGTGQPGWWKYSHSSETAPLPGLPGIGQTSAGVELPFGQVWDIPLGAYSTVQSPWGLLDMSGGCAEWIEEFYFPHMPEERVMDGTAAGWKALQFDEVSRLSSFRPRTHWAYGGVRLASPIPAPPAAILGAVALGVFGTRLRR